MLPAAAHRKIQELSMSHAATFLDEVVATAQRLQPETIEALCAELVSLRERAGRLFIIGVGGSAGNCSHAVNDFRKLCGIEAYAPTDNVSELTARTNDEGWPTVFAEWLKVSRANAKDAILVFSVGGGNLEKNVSPNLVRALQYAKAVGAKIVGIVGRDGGYTAKVGDAVCIIPTVNPDAVTPHSEAFQAIIWHLLVSHPALKAKQTKWEDVERTPEKV
jgi:D-sedoheptulose 7-phosphate isomerase